ncbi:uncharacterized protein [Notamacropus eugenii]|uniref:uncharacterized protein n=1 Tax=Notamacropus eugenii TaxID=9315 RepID=UPI003B67F042
MGVEATAWKGMWKPLSCVPGLPWGEGTWEWGHLSGLETWPDRRQEAKRRRGSRGEKLSSRAAFLALFSRAPGVTGASGTLRSDPRGAAPFGARAIWASLGSFWGDGTFQRFQGGGQDLNPVLRTPTLGSSCDPAGKILVAPRSKTGFRGRHKEGGGSRRGSSLGCGGRAGARRPSHTLCLGFPRRHTFLPMGEGEGPQRKPRENLP